MYKNHCSEMLESIYQRSKSAQRKLVEYILNNKQKVAGQTIFELSENAGVSYATVCRLVKALGYGGYRNLKRALVDELYESKAEQYELDLATDTSQILRQLCRAISAAAGDCEKSFNCIEIEKAANRILGARFVYFIGMGASASSAHYAYNKLFRLSIPTALDTDSTIFKMRCSLLSPDDILFAISSSGRTRGVVDACALAKQSGATVICLCDKDIAPIYDEAHIHLTTGLHQLHLLERDDFPILIGHIAIIDMLHALCLKNAGSKLKQLYSKAKRPSDSEKYIHK